MTEGSGFFERLQGSTYREMPYGALSGMLEHNPDNEILAKELQSRQQELNQNPDLVNAVRGRIAMLLTGERGYQTPDQIEAEVFGQNPDFDKPRYKDMVAQTIFAVSQEWKFRGEKNVYNPEDEEKLIPEDKTKLERILSQQHVKTGITGNHLPNYNQLATTSKGQRESGLARIAGLQRTITLDGRATYNEPEADTDSKAHSESKTEGEGTINLPKNARDLADLLQADDTPEVLRKAAANRLGSMFKELRDRNPRTITDEFMLRMQSSAIEDVEESDGKWKKIAENLSLSPSEYEELLKRKKVYQGDGIKYEGLIEIAFEGYVRLARCMARTERLLSQQAAGTNVTDSLRREAELQQRIQLNELFFTPFEDKSIFELREDALGKAQGQTGETRSSGRPAQDRSEAGERAGRTSAGEVPPNSTKKEKADYELPKDKEAQRALMIPLVEMLEAENKPLVPRVNGDNNLVNREILDKVLMLMRLPSCDRDLRAEVEARLCLIQCFIISAAIPSNSEQAIIYLKSVFAEPIQQQFALEGRHLELFLQTGLPGLDVRKAFDAIQRLTREKKLSEQNVYDILLEGDKNPSTEKIGQVKKSYFLAIRLTRALFEQAPADNLGRNIVAKATNFREWRLNSDNDTGPRTTVERIPIVGLASSFLRTVTTDEEIELPDGMKAKKYLYRSDPECHPAYLKDKSPQVRMKEAFKRVKGIDLQFDKDGWPVYDPNAVGDIVDIDTIDFSKLKMTGTDVEQKGGYISYISSFLPDLYALVSGNVLLKSKWSAEELNPDVIDDLAGKFDKIDAQGILRLKKAFVRGLLYEVMTNVNTIVKGGWTWDAYSEFRKTLVKKTKSGKVFLTEADMKSIEDQLNNGADESNGEEAVDIRWRLASAWAQAVSTGAKVRG